MGPSGCPETSIRNYHCSLRNNPEERSFSILGYKTKMFRADTFGNPWQFVGEYINHSSIRIELVGV
jgi:hypothetical protein